MQPLREAEAERQLLVVPRCPHRHRDRLAVDPDLERLLDGEQVLLGSTPGETDDVDLCGAVRRDRHPPNQRSRRSRSNARFSSARPALGPLILITGSGSAYQSPSTNAASLAPSSTGQKPVPLNSEGSSSPSRRAAIDLATRRPCRSAIRPAFGSGIPFGSGIRVESPTA